MKTSFTLAVRGLLFFAFFIGFNSTLLKAQLLMGVTNWGGTGTGGTIYTMPYNASSYSNVYNFTVDVPGANPYYVKPCNAPNGKIYGTTNTGGKYNLGVIWSYEPSSNTYTVMHNFNTADGTNPYGGLILATDGRFYGMTRLGGANNVGTIYKFNDTTGVYTKVHDFVTANGASPRGRLMQASNGLLYGTTFSGGANSLGVLFSFNPVGNVYTKLYDMTSANGSNPVATVVEHAGSLYGVTTNGGANSVGAIYQWNLSTSAYTLKYSFVSSTDGSTPYGTMIKAANNKLYGLTYAGRSEERRVGNEA